MFHQTGNCHDVRFREGATEARRRDDILGLGTCYPFNYAFKYGSSFLRYDFCYFSCRPKVWKCSSSLWMHPFSFLKYWWCPQRGNSAFTSFYSLVPYLKSEFWVKDNIPRQWKLELVYKVWTNIPLKKKNWFLLLYWYWIDFTLPKCMVRCVNLEALHIQRSPLITILITCGTGFSETDLRKKIHFRD